ncbi:MAG: thiamine-phosphate kinase [Bacillota bacterium]
MKIEELGEFGLIERLTRHCRQNRNIAVGVGDDAAVINFPAERQLVACCDMLVEGVHFLKSTSSPYHIGHKALAVNLSDIAAMAAVPRYFLVSIAIPKSWSVEELDELYQGMNDLATAWGIDLIGGDTTSSPDGLVIDLTCLGEVERDKAVLRSGAKVGDLLVVTNDLGASAAGLAVLSHPEMMLAPDLRAEVVQRHLMPDPQIPAARMLSARGWITALNDISDGIASESLEIARASRLGVRLYAAQMPISPATRTVAELLDLDPLEWVLNGGEDFQLVMTMPPQVFKEARAMLASAADIILTEVGEMVAEDEGYVVVDSKGRSRPLTPSGYNHFR